MKLFYCKQCEEEGESPYVTGVHATIKVELGFGRRHTCGKNVRWTHWSDEELEVDMEKIAAAGPRCSWCDSLVELVEMEECPHNWHSWGNSNERTCQLCGKRETGKVVF